MSVHLDDGNPVRYDDFAQKNRRKLGLEGLRTVWSPAEACARAACIGSSETSRALLMLAPGDAVADRAAALSGRGHNGSFFCPAAG